MDKNLFTFALIKSAALQRLHGDAIPILENIRDAGFVVMGFRQRMLVPWVITDFYRDHVRKDYWPELQASIGDEIAFMVLYHPDEAIKRFRDLIGPTNASDALRYFPSSLRARFGATRAGAPVADNAIHGSDSVESFMREMKLFYISQEG